MIRFINCNIPTVSAYEVNISQLIRYYCVVRIRIS